MSGASAGSKGESHFLWHLLKCVAFQIGQAVGFSIQQPPLPDGPCHRGSKTWADTPSLRVPEIPAGPIGWARSALLFVVFVEAEECIPVNQFKVECAASGDDAADFESAGDCLVRIVFQPEGGPGCLQLLGGYEEFGGDLVAEAFDPDVWRQQSVEKGQAGLAGEDVGDFVGEGEELGGYEVCRVDENKGGEFVDEGETLELGGVEFAGCVVADDAVEDDEDADLVELIAEMAEREVPGGNLCGPAGLEVERGVHGCGDFGVAVARVVGTDEGEGVFFVLDKFIAHPGLAALHLIDGVEQVGARTVRRLAGAGAEVLDGKALVGGIVEVEVAERCVGLGGEFVGLSDADFAGLFPLGDAVEFDGDLFGQVLLGEAGAFAGPAEDVGLEGDLEVAACHNAGGGGPFRFGACDYWPMLVYGIGTVYLTLATIQYGYDARIISVSCRGDVRENRRKGCL